MKKILCFGLICANIIFAQVKSVQNNSKTIKVTKKEFKTNNEIIGYLIGFNMASQVNGKGVDKTTIDHFIKGFLSSMNGDSLIFSQAEIQKISEEFSGEMMKKQQLASKENEGKEKAFFEANKKKEGIISLENGLQYKVIKAGSGEAVQADSKVKVHYTGKLVDGKVFDSSVGREPFEVNMAGGVIPGWIEILKLMRVGDKWEVFIPSNLGYGEQGSGPIPPSSTLIFEMEVISISK